MVSRRAFYERVNAAWPPGPLPKLTETEAVKAARKLWRFVTGHTVRAVYNSHVRYSRLRYGQIEVQPRQGWHAFVHSLSHSAARRTGLTGYGKHHTKDHARLELRMVKEVVKRGWLDGRLKDKPKVEKAAPPPSAKLDHAVRMLAKALTRQKRATTIAKKWARRVTRLQKAPKQPPRQDREDHGDQAA